MIRLVAAIALAVALMAVAPSGAQEPAKVAPAKTAATAAVPLNLNTATQAQLENLPGIGPRVAERIVEYRQKNGGFKKVEELMNVKGVGEKSFLKLKTLVIVSPPKTERLGQNQ